MSENNHGSNESVEPRQEEPASSKPTESSDVARPLSLLIPKSIRKTDRSSVNPSSAYIVTETDPIDVAAHMKLLGDSLRTIGRKLMKHEGKIAVHGSLSVLLDSLLTVLGPLLCLTGLVDEMNGAVPEETLKSILDDIAYITPGIV